jgi:hypothetical protein
MMPVEKVPTTIAELLATATQHAANTNKHREAMAQVAAQAKAKVPALPAAEGVTK